MWHILLSMNAFLKMCFIWSVTWQYFLNWHAINELMTFPKFLEKSCYQNSFLLSFQANLLLFIFFWQYINFWEFIHLTMTHHCLCSMDKRGGLHNWKWYQWSPKGVLEVARRKRMSDIRRRIPKSIRHRWNRLTLSPFKYDFFIASEPKNHKPHALNLNGA